MAFVFNIAKGRVAEFYNRVKTGDPAASALIIVPIHRGSVPNSTLEDLETLAAVKAQATERTTDGWTRKTLTAADLAALAADHTNNRISLSLPTWTWTSVGAPGGAITDYLVCYDGNTGAGTDTDIIPLTCHVFPITPVGSNVVVNAAEFFRGA